MRIFDFSPAQFRAAYQHDGFVHIKAGAHPTFLELARQQVARREAAPRLAGQGLAGEKDQFLFELPASFDYEREIFDVLTPLTSLRSEGLTLSERHVKIYSSDAAPFPLPHKDRLSSQVAVGISIDVPAGSHLVLYPYDDREVNPYLATGYLESLEPERRPEVTLRGATEVEVHDAPGDVIVFPGSSMWHLRRHSAGTINVYLKLNDFGADPLGEDPSTSTRREQTLAALEGPRGVFEAAIPVLSRTFEEGVHTWSRASWQERRVAHLWGRKPVALSIAQEQLLRTIGDRRPVSQLVHHAGGMSSEAAEGALRFLAENGVVDLMPPDTL